MTLDSMPEGGNLWQGIRLQHGNFQVGVFYEGFGFRISGVDVASHADARIIGEYPFDTLSHFFSAVGDRDLTGMLRVTDANTAAIVNGHPGCAAGGVEQSIQQWP